MPVGTAPAPFSIMTPIAIFGASTGISYELVNLILKKDKNPYFFFSSNNIENLKKLVNKFNLPINQYDLYSLDLTKNEINLKN